MQPPFKQPLQAKGQPAVDKSSQNNPPVVNSPTKAGGQPCYHDVRTASQLCPQEKAPLPVADMQAPNLPYFPSHPELQSPQQQGSTSYISEQSPHPLYSVYGPLNTSVSRSNPGRWYGISGFPITDRPTTLPSVPGATTSIPTSHYTPASRQHKQRDFGSQAFPQQHAQLSRPMPQVPVTKQLFVSVPSAPLSCPPTSPLTRMTTPAKGDPSSPGKRTVFFEFGEGIDEKQISQIIKKMAEAAERHTGDTCEVIPTIKLQDPPLSKVKRRRSSDSDNIPSSGNSSKTGSPTKSKCLDLDASARNPKEPPQVVNKTLEDAKRYDNLSNAQFGKLLRDSPHPGKNPGIDSQMERPPSLNWSKAKETMPTRQSLSVANTPPSLPQSSHKRLSPSRQSRDGSHSRRMLRYPDLEVPREHRGKSMKILEENNRNAKNECVSIILNESREPTAINVPRSVDSHGNSSREGGSVLLAAEETICRQELQNRKGKSSSCRIARGSENDMRSSTLVFPGGRTTLSHGCDEVDGMDTPMDCDDGYSYDQMYARSSFATRFSQASSVNSEYQGIPGSPMTSQGYIANSVRDDLNRQPDRYARQTSHAYNTPPIQSQTSTFSGHPGSYGSRGQALNPMPNERARGEHLGNIGQSFTHDRNFFSKPLHSFSNADVISSSAYTRSINHSQQDRTFPDSLHSDFSGVHRQTSSARSRVPYKKDHQGRVVVEPEQVEDTSTDVVNIFGSDDDSPNNSNWLAADQRSRTKDFNNNNNGSIMPDSCHVVPTRADTNVHFIDPMELSDSSSMSCEDRSDHSNTSLPQEDCVPESKLSRFYRCDETDGGNAPQNESETVQTQRRCYAKDVNLPPAEEYSSLSQTSLAMTSCKGLHSSAEDILASDWRKTPMAYKSRSQESILSDKINPIGPGSDFAEHNIEKRYDLTPNSHSHPSFVSRQWHQDQFMDRGRSLSNCISRIKTFENLSAIQPKTLTDPKRGCRKSHPEKRAGFIRIKEARRKQKGGGYENRKSWSSSLPRRPTTNSHHSLPKKKTCSRSLDDLLQQNRYQESQYESDDDGCDEVDGLGDDDKQKSKSANSVDILNKSERNKQDNRDDESDVVHCFNEPSGVLLKKESEIVSCFDENLDKPSQSNHLSAIGQDLVDRNNDAVTQSDGAGKDNDRNVVHCMSDTDDTDGTVANAASSKQQQMCVTSSTVYKCSEDKFRMEDETREYRGQNYTHNITNVIPEHFPETPMTLGTLPSSYDHSTNVEKRLQTPSKSMTDKTPYADMLSHHTIEDEKTRERYRQILMFPGDQRISTPSSSIHESLDNINQHSIQRSCSLNNDRSSLHHEKIDPRLDVHKGLSFEHVKIQKQSEDTAYRSFQYDNDSRHENDHKINQSQLNTMASSDIEMCTIGLNDPSPNDREIVKNQTPNVLHSREQYKQRGITAGKVQAARKVPKFHRPWLPSLPRADSNEEKAVTHKAQRSSPAPRLLREPVLSPMPHLYSRSQSDKDGRQTTTGIQGIDQPSDSFTLSFSDTSHQQQQQQQQHCLDMSVSSAHAQVFGSHSLLNKTSSDLSQHFSASPVKSFGLRSRDIRGPESSRPTKSNVIKSTKRSAVTKLDFGQTSIFNQPSASTSGEPEYAYQRQEGSKTQFDINRPYSQTGMNTASVVTSGMADVITGHEENSESDPSSSNLVKRPDRDKDEIDVKIQVTDVMEETRSLGQRLEEIYQSNRGECECARVEQEVLQTALDMFGKLCAAPETQANFSQELRKTNKVITDTLEMAASLRQLCRHGRQVSDVLPGSVILRLKCKTLMGVLDLWRMHKDGELPALLFVILGMRHRKLAPGVTFRVSIDETNVKTCLAFLRCKISGLMGLSAPRSRSPKKKSPAKRVVKSTENLLSSPSSPLSPRSVHERWSSTPVLPTKSPLASPMYGNSPSCPVYRRERKFSFGDSTRSAFQELNLSDTDSPSSSYKEDQLPRPDFLFRRIRSPALMTSPPSTSPLTPPIRLKRCEVIQEQENIVHPFDDDAWFV